MRLYTIGFTKKSAEAFFTRLHEHGVTCLVDIRLRPNGQLSGFARGEDLPYFLRHLAASDYVHMKQLAPSDELLTTYRRDHDWERYARGYQELMRARAIPDALDRAWFAGQACCFLCSEATPEHCHRGLLAELIASAWGDVEIVHII